MRHCAAEFTLMTSCSTTIARRYASSAASAHVQTPLQLCAALCFIEAGPQVSKALGWASARLQDTVLPELCCLVQAYARPVQDARTWVVNASIAAAVAAALWHSTGARRALHWTPSWFFNDQRARAGVRVTF